MKDQTFRNNKGLAKTLSEMKNLEVSESQIKKIKNENAMKNDTNDFKDFISVMYNVILIIMWYAFALVYYAEVHKFGFKLTMNKPLYYL